MRRSVGRCATAVQHQRSVSRSWQQPALARSLLAMRMRACSPQEINSVGCDCRARGARERLKRKSSRGGMPYRGSFDDEGYAMLS
jgi:hypothetical protein